MGLFEGFFSRTPRYSPMLEFLSHREIQKLDALIATPGLFSNVHILNHNTDVLRLLADSPTPCGSIFSPEGDHYIDSWEALSETLAQVLPTGTLISPPLASRNGFIARVSPDCVAALNAEI